MSTTAHLTSTICAPATPQGVGALALIRMSGPQALEIAGKVFHSASCPDIKQSEGYRTYFGHVRDSAGELLDEVLLSVFRAPHSYTGEDSVEISCHGSLYIQDTLLRTLVEKGAVLAGPGEFSQRAFMNGKMDLAQAEAVADLIASENRTSHKLAMDQMRGVFSQEMSALRSRLLELASLMELELDFSDEDVEFADKTEVRSLVDSLVVSIGKLCVSFSMGNAMKKGVPVAIAGLVNAGKSTLLNALLGEEKALVTPVAGTTRDTIEDVLVVDGIPFRFIDTAGLRHIGQVDEMSQEHVEKLGVKRSLETIRSASVLMLVLDASRPETFTESLQSVATFKNEYILFIINKIDLVYNKDVIFQEFMNNLCNTFVTLNKSNTSTLLLSAAKNIGIEDIKNTLVSMIRPNLDRNAIILTNLRHYQELCAAGEALKRVSEGLDSGLSTDLLTPDLRQALHHIGSITGEITPDDILGEIFGRFCIGK
ncbi:MAG TPA: tRNA uridine-5-carboxymethylaminomethyl(34) synthesis GTPase MnmE [Bacteroidales bacterium]|nr:tRNA uridine-5-carboxymethylaminomethyl(34) synthesis GTPase MnmE [Bacteroidales bacterium]HQP64270.1 tRNA uridine-5-carboxymethylaminomethyl(34) synthesis GTPase MnmE [Bacteroidales bacterium]